MIAFVGSVFSPAYFRSRRSQLFADPTAHCGLNVVVHGERGASWAFSEYRGDAVQRSADVLVLGNSRIVRDESGLHVLLDERTAPWGRPLRGRIDLHPHAWMDRRHALDAGGRHVWWPVAPRASITVELEAPRLRFVGTGYHDSNGGIEPLEQAFARWTWSRASNAHGTALLYDVTERDGTPRELGVHYGADGSIAPLPAPDPVALGRSRWGLARATRTRDDGRAQLRRTLVDAPFYARSLIDTDLAGTPALGVHEVVDLTRFTRRSTQLMLPFRTRGVGWW